MTAEQSARLAIWLNSLEEVKAVLALDFNGRPITEQNVSDWKLGGFVDWQQLQESREWVRIVTDEADQVAEESGPCHCPMTASRPWPRSRSGNSFADLPQVPNLQRQAG